MRGVGRYLKEEVKVRRAVEKRWMRIRFVFIEESQKVAQD